MSRQKLDSRLNRLVSLIDEDLSPTEYVAAVREHANEVELWASRLFDPKNLARLRLIQRPGGDDE